MKRYPPAAIRQHATHDEVVGPAAPPASLQAKLPLDAIIVPASRPAQHLQHAIGLARAMSCELVVLCSRQAAAADVRELIDRRRLCKATVIDLPDGYTHELFEFETTSWVGEELHAAGVCRDTDLSMKRNIGLALAHMTGWERVFFLDDDIAGFYAPGLRRTVSMLGRYKSVGMRVRKFPDNSVVCHAHRATGGYQGVNVSGSALAVDCTVPSGFFPHIYNEDWLFFYDHAKAGDLGSSGINVRQLRYDPFADPQRAAKQEFGDVLAEGLFAMLHDPVTGVDSDYWIHFLAAREHFLDAIIERLETGPRPRPEILRAVGEAQQCLAQIQPYHCEHYIKLWRADLGSWQRRLGGLRRDQTIAGALARIGLAAAEAGNPSGPARARTSITGYLPSRSMVPTSPAILSGMAAEFARTLLGGVTGPGTQIPVEQSATAGRKWMHVPVDMLSASMKWAVLTTASGMLWVRTARTVGLRPPGPPAAGGGRWKVADPRRWRRTPAPATPSTSVPPPEGDEWAAEEDGHPLPGSGLPVKAPR